MADNHRRTPCPRPPPPPDQASEIPVSGTSPCTYPKWADLGKMGENGEKCGKFWMLNGKMENFGAKKAKKHGFDWQQGYGGGCIGESSQGKMGEIGGNWGKMGEPNQSTLAPHFLLFAPTSPHNTPFPPISSHFPLIPPRFPPFPPITPHFPPFPPISPSFPPVFPHFPPFPPISPHFPPFFLVLGTLRVRCWVYYHPPRPGISEAC